MVFFLIFFLLKQINIISPDWPLPSPTPTSTPTISLFSLEITSIENVGRAIELKWTDLGDDVEYKVYRRWGKSPSAGFDEVAKVKTNYYKDKLKESQNGYTYYYYIGVTDENGNKYASPKRGINFVY